MDTNRVDAAARLVAERYAGRGKGSATAALWHCQRSDYHRSDALLRLGGEACRARLEHHDVCFRYRRHAESLMCTIYPVIVPHPDDQSLGDE